MGLEHAVVVMFYFSMAFMVDLIRDGGETLFVFAGPGGELVGIIDFFSHLTLVTAGNILGGGVLVGIVYWFVYLYPRREA